MFKSKTIKKTYKTHSKTNPKKQHSKIIIHIDGVQGSGKSYICSKLHNIKCIDTDDIMQEVKSQIEKIQGRKFPKQINKETLELIKTIENKIINNYIDNNDIIVFAGMTVKIPNPTYKFFIKLTDLSASYKRLLLRELDKIYSNYSRIKNYIITEDNPREINTHNIALTSIPFPVSYDDFLADYKERLIDAKTLNYTPKTQEQIINFINNL